MTGNKQMWVIIDNQTDVPGSDKSIARAQHFKSVARQAP